MADPKLPPCGIYRTTRPIGDVPAGRLVYFHNHGDPGPGVYLPVRWVGNRARFHQHGTVLREAGEAETLEPLSAEGFYRVAEAFHCCEKRCHLFEVDALVQLGYDGAGDPVLFTPEIVDDLLAVPQLGTKIDRNRIERLRPLRVPVAHREAEEDLH